MLFSKAKISHMLFRYNRFLQIIPRLKNDNDNKLQKRKIHCTRASVGP